MDDIRIAIYIRLSKADEETGKSRDESDSIVNQRSLIHRFLDNNEELGRYPRTEFVDDGFTGTNTERPAFRRMINKIREGKFNVCISKDFSRFSRDYIEMGDYLECLFPLLRVRYISINDGYDSSNYKGTTGGLDVVMRTIVYDAYSKDLSIKEKSGKLQSMKKGRRSAGDPPYGYIKDPGRKARNIIDTEPANVVRRIFDEAIAGKKVGAIAEGLNNDGILTPAQYFRKKHPENGRFANLSEKQKWTYYTVLNIIQKYTYTGASVGGLRKQLVPCKKMTTKASRDEWIIVPDMHEAIVSAEEFEKAQKVVRKISDRTNVNVKYPLKSLVICGYCGRHMIRYGNTKRFNCSYGRNGGNEDCREHRSPPEKDMEEVAFKAIKNYISLNHKESKCEKSRNAGKDNRTGNTINTIPEIDRQIKALKHKKMELYEKYCDGLINKQQYMIDKSVFDKDISKCEAAIEEMKISSNAMPDEAVELTSESQAVCEAFKGAEELTYDMAHAFIDKVIVYRDNRIEIKWRFSDCFEKNEVKEL